MASTLLSPYAVSVASRVGAQVSAFVLIMVASRALDLAAFGSYAIAWALTVICITMVYTGAYHVLMRATDFEGVVDTLFWQKAAVGTLCALGLATIGGLAFWMTDAPTTAIAILMFAPIPICAVVTAWNEAQLMRQGRVRLTSLSLLGAEVTGLIGAVILFDAGYGIYALVLSRYASMAFAMVLSTAVVRRLPRLRYARDVGRKSLQEAWPLWGSTSLSMISNYGADLVMAAFLSPAAVGAFRAGSRVANTAADVVLQPLTTISWARFARLESRQEQREIRAVWKDNMALGFALITPVMVSISLLADPIVQTLFDPSWGAVAGIVAIIALARATDATSFLLQATLTCLGRVKAQFYVEVARAALLLGLLLWLGRHSGEAAALAILLTGAIAGIVSLVLMMQAAAISVKDLAETLLPGTALTGLCVLVIALMDPARDVLAPALALTVTVSALALVWLVTVGGLLRYRVLVLPTP